MKFLKLNCYALFGFLLLAHSQAIRASSHPIENIRPQNLFVNFADMIQSSWVATASLGSSWEHAGDKQTFFLTPEIEKTYTANHSTHTFGSGELFLGIKKSLHKNFQGQIGVEFASTGGASLSGNIWEDANSNFDNYTYQYNIHHTRISLKGKLLGDWGLPLQPWISSAIGIGLNRASDFSSSPTIFEAVPIPNFASNTTTSFTYTVGIGVERDVVKHWKAGLGYEFADWGKSQLSRASGQTLHNGLSLSHLYTSSVFLNLTYQS